MSLLDEFKIKNFLNHLFFTECLYMRTVELYSNACIQNATTQEVSISQEI